MSGLVLWLPHGYEGQGAEHSSARLERYLQLCAEKNMQVAYPTTPAQLFHLLRRQLMSRVRKPLIMMAPKSMLRQKLSFSTLDEFTSGAFQPVIGETDSAVELISARRVLLCSGKLYYDLLAEREKRAINDIAIVRIERLYPFPYDELGSQMAKYAAAKEVVWVQEEPQNQGAWLSIKKSIKRSLQAGQSLSRLSRKAAAAPAVGSAKRHKQEQEELVNAALSEEKL